MNDGFREKAGTIIAAVIILSYIAVGFVQMASVMFIGIEVGVPDSWSSSMLSLASAALGFLIGKQMNQTGSMIVPVGDQSTVQTTVKP